MSSANEMQVGGDHYKAGYQHWDMITDFHIGYLEGCATKYLTRWRKKNGLEDLKKALHFTQKLIEKADAGHRPLHVVDSSAIARFFRANPVDETTQGAIYGLLTWTTHGPGRARLDRSAALIADLIRIESDPA